MLMKSRRDLTALLCTGGIAITLLSGCNGSSEPDATATSGTQAAAENVQQTARSEADTAADDQSKWEISDPAQPTKTAPEAQADPADRTAAQQEALERRLELQRQLARARPASAGGFKVTAEPTSLELGDIPLNDSKTGVVTLRNTSEEPMTIVRCNSSCGCTAAQCPEGVTLQPGEVRDVEIRMNGGNNPQTISKKVTFIVEGQDPMEVPVIGHAVAFIETIPNRVVIDRMDGQPLIIRAKDDQPFRIQRMVPAIATNFDTEAKVEHELHIEWDRWEAVAGNLRRLTIFTDHPRSARTTLFVQPPVTRVPARDQLAGAGNQDALRQEMLDEAKRQAEAKAQPTSDPVSMIARDQVEEFISALRAGEIDLGARDRNGLPLLSLAAQRDSVEMVEALLEAGADLEVRDNTGATPLMAAAKSASVEMVQFLIDAGASVRATDVIGNQALGWAAGFGDPRSLSVLMDAGCELEQSGGPVGFTPLMWAAGYGTSEAVSILLGAGAQVNARDIAQGATALMHAARTAKLESMQLLLEAHADLEVTTYGGETVLLLAAKTSGATVDVIRALVEAGADLKTTDMTGRDVLTLARQRSDVRAPAIVAYLESTLSDG